jgi:hypothetical protein
VERYFILHASISGLWSGQYLTIHRAVRSSHRQEVPTCTGSRLQVVDFHITNTFQASVSYLPVTSGSGYSSFYLFNRCWLGSILSDIVPPEALVPNALHYTLVFLDASQDYEGPTRGIAWVLQNAWGIHCHKLSKTPADFASVHGLGSDHPFILGAERENLVVSSIGTVSECRGRMREKLPPSQKRCGSRSRQVTIKGGKPVYRERTCNW